MYTSPKKWEEVVSNGKSKRKGDIPHVPVFLEEVISWLECRPGRHYLDCTVGYGGLAAQILERTGSDGRLLGVDRDRDAIEGAGERLRPFGARVVLAHGNFSDLRQHVAAAGHMQVNGVVFDLGVSSRQLDEPKRGFSFLAKGPLDMRMDRSAGPTAQELLERLPEAELAQIISRYGEERFARRIARAIVRFRASYPLRTTLDLVSVIRQAVPPVYRHGRLHCATRTFQAIRIALNRELDVLEGALRDAADLLIQGGRLCIISFHSLEDRIAKRTLRSLSQEPHPLLRILTKKPLVPSEHEQTLNPRARSAKLRVAERIGEGVGA